MVKWSRIPWLRTALLLCVAAVSGALAGAAAGWSTASWQWAQDARGGVGLETPTEEPQTTSSTSNITVIPVDRAPQAALVPAPFESRRSSSMAGVYHPSVRGGDALLTDLELVAQAVAVTSDGWFVVPAKDTASSFSSVEDVPMDELLVWYEGATAPVTRMVEDTLGGVVFLKTSLANVNAPAFARGSDVTAGLAAWLERRANQFEPVGIAALGAPVQALVGVPSEQTVRRGVLTVSRNDPRDQGAPVWSANGALVGLMTSTGPTHYIPASAWTSSLSSLLTTGEIRHAYLGVRSVDLAWTRVVRSGSDALPVRGALVAHGAQGAAREPAIALRSPAAEAGLRVGDVIERVDRDMLDGSVDLGEVLAGYRPGTRVTLTVVRNGTSLELPVTLGSVVTSRER